MTNIITDIQRPFNFEVVKKPLFVQLDESNVQRCEGKVALVNDLTFEVLSFMSPQYRLFQNQEFVELTERISESLGLEIDHYNSYKGGRKILSAFRNQEKNTICGHEFNENIVLFDSRDGTMCLGIAGLGRLNRCDNMFASIQKAGNVLKVNHSSKLDEMVASFEASLEMTRVLRQNTIQRLEALEAIPVTQQNVYQLIGGWVDLKPNEIKDVAYGKHQGQISTRKLNIINGLCSSWDAESADLGNNGFALHNMTTNYFTHNRKKDENDLLFADFGRKELQTIQFAEALL